MGAWLTASTSRLARFVLWTLALLPALWAPTWLARLYPSIKNDLVQTVALCAYVFLSGGVAFWPELHPRLTRLRSSPSARTRLERWALTILPLLLLGVVIADAAWRNPTEAAAVATASTVAYIAYQSWQTRRAAEAAERGLATAERSMETTEHSLRVSQIMAAEAEKARLDQRAPDIRGSLKNPCWPPAGPPLSAESEPPQLPTGHIYRLPKNAGDQIILWAEGEVKNNKHSLTVDAELRNLRLGPEPPAGRDVDPDDLYWSPPNRALLLLAFATACRRSELAALDVGDVSEDEDCARITVRRSKGDQEAAGEVKGVPFGAHPATCPVRALRAWLRLAEGPIFRPVDRHGRLSASRMFGDAIADLIKRAAARAGLDPRQFAGHSTRRGFAITAARNGAPERWIQRQTGHRSVVMLRAYVEDGTLFTENAATYLGL